MAGGDARPTGSLPGRAVRLELQSGLAAWDGLSSLSFFLYPILQEKRMTAGSARVRPTSLFYIKGKEPPRAWRVCPVSAWLMLVAAYTITSATSDGYNGR